MSGRILDEDLLDAEKVASFLEVNPVTVYRWCREGRLPCLKVGRYWRIRSQALESFLRQSEQSVTLVGQLRSFITVPDSLIAVAENHALLHRLDVAFFKVAEAQGGMLVKFYGKENASEEDLRASYVREELDVGRLESEGRMIFRDEDDPSEGRKEALGQLAEEYSEGGRTIWASFDWTKEVDLDKALEQQAEVAEVVNSQQMVVKTAVLEEFIEAWDPTTLRKAQAEHSGMVWLSEKGVSASRITLL